MNYTRDLIVAPRDYARVKERYPNRNVVSEIYAPEGEVHYFNPKGKVRRLVLRDKSLWECDHERGFPYMKRVRDKSPQEETFLQIDAAMSLLLKESE